MIFRVTQREYKQNAARVAENPLWGQGFYFKAPDGKYYKTWKRGIEGGREMHDFVESMKIKQGKGQIELTEQFKALL